METGGQFHDHPVPLWGDPRSHLNSRAFDIYAYFLCATYFATHFHLHGPWGAGYNPGPQGGYWLEFTRPRVEGVCMGTQVPADYRPSENEPFMNERQREYFRRKLNLWKEEILKESRETIQNLQAETVPHADLADRASTEAERQLELRTRDRQRKLIAKIDAALRRIEDGSYGFCEETGEPISLKRLDARPIATLSIEAQERHERREKVYRDD